MAARRKISLDVMKKISIGLLKQGQAEADAVVEGLSVGQDLQRVAAVEQAAGVPAAARGVQDITVRTSGGAERPMGETTAHPAPKAPQASGRAEQREAEGPQKKKAEAEEARRKRGEAEEAKKKKEDEEKRRKKRENDAAREKAEAAKRKRTEEEERVAAEVLKKKKISEESGGGPPTSRMKRPALPTEAINRPPGAPLYLPYVAATHPSCLSEWEREAFFKLLPAGVGPKYPFDLPERREDGPVRTVATGFVDEQAVAAMSTSLQTPADHLCLMRESDGQA